MLPSTSRKYFLSFLLSGTILATWVPGFAAPQPAPVATPHTHHELQKPKYPGRASKIEELYVRCAMITPYPELISPYAKILHENLRLLKESQTIIGPALANFAAKENILYCFQQLGEGKAGDWQKNDGIANVRYETGYSKESYLATQAHETIHAIQDKNDISIAESNWSIFETQKALLSLESAARTSEYLLALELYQRGKADLWHTTEMKNDGMSLKVISTYNTARNQQGATHAEALARAGEAGFYEQMKDQSWLDFYNGRALTYYLQQLSSKTLQPPFEKYSLQTAQKNGQITPEFNFTSKIRSLPENSQLFGDNKRMQQAFEYINLEHLAQTLGRNNHEYRKTLWRLERMKNPYLGVDVKRVAKSLENNPNALSALEMMSCYAGLDNCYSPTDKSFDPAKLKIKMRP